MGNEDFYLEKLKIAERLQSVENTLLVHTTKMTDSIERMDRLLAKHSEEIWGNGKPGLKTHVDRMIFIGKFAWVIYIAVAGLVAEKLWGVINK